MNIHDSENNLEEINNSCENIEENINNADDNLEEMNPYVDKNDDIHALEIDVNNVIDIQESQSTIQPINDNVKENSLMKFINDYNKQIHAKQLVNKRRNDIMRSVALERNDKNTTVKQMIKAGIPINSDKHRLNILTEQRLSILRGKTNITPEHRLNILRRKSAVAPNKSGNLISKKSFDNRNTPSITIGQFTSQQPHKYVENSQIRSEPVEPNSKVLPFTKNFIMSDDIPYKTNHPVIETPKDVNLAEIVTTVLQDVLTGKITTVENIIGKLRVDFEEKSVFTNSNKRNVILLNFEDDTMRPVLKIDDKYMNIIEEWYNYCDLLIDIEETNVSIPEAITVEDMSGVLFQDIHYKFKDEYLNNYIPLVINNIISDRTAKSFEKKYFKTTNDIKSTISEVKVPKLRVAGEEYFKPQKATNDNIVSNIDIVLSNMGIVIPENILPKTLKIKSMLNNSGEIFPLDSSCIDKIIDPQLFSKRHLFSDIRKNEIFEKMPMFSNIRKHELDKMDIIPFNEIEYDDLNKEDIAVTCYNAQYNTLSPNFSENCLYIDDIDLKEDAKETKLSSIFVLMNDKFLQTMTILEPTADVTYIIKNYPEYGFIKLFDIATNNKDIISFVEKEFNAIHFNDIEEINKKLLVTSQYIDFSNKHNNAINIASSEENQVKKFLNSKYIIDNDINHKMKASILYDLIVNSKVVKIENNKVSGFRTRLSKYLKDIGLQKKRYNDGFYYYGIYEKENKSFKYGTRDNKINIDIRELENQRREEEKIFIFNENDFSKH